MCWNWLTKGAQNASVYDHAGSNPAIPTIFFCVRSLVGKALDF